MFVDRLPTAFHETFALNLPAISAIVSLSSENQGHVDADAIRAETSLGRNYVKAMPRYARGSGLVEMGSYELTPFGKTVSMLDPHLVHPTTLWLMHYHLSAPHGPGPSAWSHLVARCLPFQEETTGGTLAEEIRRFLASEPDARPLQERTLRATATVFVGTYTKSDGLGQLGLLQKAPSRVDCVRVLGPQSPPSGAVAYALADYWAAHYPEYVTVSLSELARDDGFAKVMWMDPRKLEDALERLRLDGLLDLYRIAPPYQVARRWSSKEELLSRLYK